MTTKAELQKRIAELEAAQAEAATLYQISRGLNAARDEDELLQVLVQPALETGATMAHLLYIDLNEAGEPEWAEVVAIWPRKDASVVPVGTRFYLPELPFSRLWMASPDKPQLVTDAATDERMDENTRNVLIQTGRCAMAVIPLTQVGRWVGLIIFTWDEPHEFSEQEVAIYQALTSLTAPAVHSRRLLVEKERALVEKLYEISRGLNTARDEDELLQILIKPALEVGAAAAILAYIDLDETNEPEWIEMVAVWQREGAPLTPIETRYYLPEFPFARLWMASPDEPQLIADATTDERVDENTGNLLAQTGSRAMVVIPLAQAGRWVGLIIFAWGEPHEFGEQEAAIYQAFMGLASPAVENRRLVKNLEQMVAERTREVAIFKTLAENATDAISISDLKGKYTYANRAYHELLGYDYETAEIIGLPVSISMPIPEEVEAGYVERFLSQILSEGWSGEVGPKRKDGTLFDAWLTTFALRDEAGNPIGIAAIFRDITEQKQAERERERLISIIESSPDFIGMATAEGQGIYINPAGLAMTGYTAEEFYAGMSIASFQPDLPPAALETAVREGSWVGESVLVHKDGHQVQTSQVITALKDDEGNVRVFTTIARDITAQKQAEQERERLQQEIIETQRQALREISTPIVPVQEGVLVLPLVGNIDSRRAQQLMETLLDAISRYQAEVVIIDITGVPVVDTGVANHLLQVTRAAGLLGSECVLVGISPEVAQTIVSLGVDLSGIATRSDLQSGVEYALFRLDRRIVST